MKLANMQRSKRCGCKPLRVRVPPSAILKNMSKSKKIALGIFTIWPIVYMAIFFLFVLSQFFITSPDGRTNEPPPGFFVIFGLHLLTIILIFILLFIYIKNVFKNDGVSQDKKALWAVVLFLGNFIAMPVYWYLYIWREPRQNQLPEQKTWNILLDFRSEFEKNHQRSKRKVES